MNHDIMPVMLGRNMIYESDWITLYSDQVKMPDGKIISSYHKIHCPQEAISVVIFNEKNEIMIVGDSLTSDMQGGNNAGIVCCWYNPKGNKNTRGLRIDYEIKNLYELKKIIFTNDF